MKKVMKITAGALTLLVMMALLAGAPQAALAHGHVEVDSYSIVVGFNAEPAYQGEPNAVSLRVTRHAEGEESEEHTEGEEGHDEAANAVTGLEETLQVEVIYGSHTRELELEPAFGDPGAYVADFLPTQAGDYTFHVWGDIEGTPVDFEMTSGPDTFSPVVSKSDVGFPDAEPSAGAIMQAAQTATLIGVAGVVFGLVGMVLGIIGMRKKS